MPRGPKGEKRPADVIGAAEPVRSANYQSLGDRNDGGPQRVAGVGYWPVSTLI
jgi:hypothetical protein